jgi:ribosomal protein S18 acetylase RimI-like enzyme
VNKVNIRTGLSSDALLIGELANKIWWQAYPSIISEEQIRFMLKEMYNPALLISQINEYAPFYIAETDDQACGFISALPKEKQDKIYRIEKIYLLKEIRGQGIGKKLINHVEEIARNRGFSILELNVNRNNPATKFYQKEGFKIVKEIDIPYHHFTLNDYVMQKRI